MGISEVTTVPLLELIAMLDCDHPEGARFIVVTKGTSRPNYVNTVLDMQAKRFFRAVSPTGMVSFWKGVAKRRAAVQLLSASEAFKGCAFTFQEELDRNP